MKVYYIVAVLNDSVALIHGEAFFILKNAEERKRKWSELMAPKNRELKFKIMTLVLNDFTED